jgi:hypothetical protein
LRRIVDNFLKESSSAETVNSVYDSDDYGEEFEQYTGEDLADLDHTTIFGKYELRKGKDKDNVGSKIQRNVRIRNRYLL